MGFNSAFKGLKVGVGKKGKYVLFMATKAYEVGE